MCSSFYATKSYSHSEGVVKIWNQNYKGFWSYSKNDNPNKLIIAKKSKWLIKSTWFKNFLIFRFISKPSRENLFLLIILWLSSGTKFWSYLVFVFDLLYQDAQEEPGTEKHYGFEALACRILSEIGTMLYCITCSTLREIEWKFWILKPLF